MLTNILLLLAKPGDQTPKKQAAQITQKTRLSGQNYCSTKVTTSSDGTAARKHKQLKKNTMEINISSSLLL